MEREVGGGIGMGNTCKPMAVSFQRITKSTTIKIIIIKKPHQIRVVFARKRGEGTDIGLAANCLPQHGAADFGYISLFCNAVGCECSWAVPNPPEHSSGSEFCP